MIFHVALVTPAVTIQSRGAAMKLGIYIVDGVRVLAMSQVDAERIVRETR